MTAKPIGAFLAFLLFSSLAGTLSAGPGSQPGDRAAALASLIAAERNFARTSEEKGIREAFLTWLAADAIVFRPEPVEGRPVYESMDPAHPAVLTWRPEFAEVAASGELGYTTGPYELRPRRGAEPSAFGHYVSVWKKQLDGGWKVIFDIGVQHDRPGTPLPAEEVGSPAASGKAGLLSPEQLRDEISAFSPMAASFDAKASGDGLRRFLSKSATEDIRVYRPGKPPSIGRAQIKGIVGAGDGLVAGGTHDNRARSHCDMAWSGDLAYSYGTFFYIRRETRKAETVSFLRLWRRDASGPWKVCLDIELPGPSPS
jgi:ketosteroid isomerase-like protein